jgi:hypothetical protein
MARAVCQLAQYFHGRSDQLSDEDIAWMLYSQPRNSRGQIASERNGVGGGRAPWAFATFGDWSAFAAKVDRRRGETPKGGRPGFES